MQYLLTALILIPVAGTLAAVGHNFAGYKKESHFRWIALIFSILTFVLSLFLLQASGGSGWAFAQDVPWINAIQAHYHVAVDGISLWLVLLTTLLVPISIVSCWNAVEKRPLAFYAFLLLLESAMIGVFVSLDVLLFYLFFEASLVPMFFLIGIWGGDRRVYAATKFFIYTAVGSLLMLAGIITVYIHCHTFDYVLILATLQQNPIRPDIEFIIFLSFALAFFIKVPLFPF